MGCALMQNGKVITYASRQLKIHENNYPYHDLEFVVVVFTLKIWCHYLNGVCIDVFTDQKILHNVFRQKEINLIHIRWFELLKDYNISILYQSSKDNVVIDALSILSMVSTIHFEEGNK